MPFTYSSTTCMQHALHLLFSFFKKELKIILIIISYLNPYSHSFIGLKQTIINIKCLLEPSYSYLWLTVLRLLGDVIGCTFLVYSFQGWLCEHSQTEKQESVTFTIFLVIQTSSNLNYCISWSCAISFNKLCLIKTAATYLFRAMASKIPL